MEYILLFTACFFFALQFVFQKMFEKRTIGGLSVCLWNQVICSLTASLFLLIKSGLPTELNLTAFLYIVGYSLCGIICSVATISAMSCGQVAMVTTFCLAGGMIIPFIYGIAALGEDAGIVRWIGIIVLCASCLPPILKKSDGSEKSADIKFVVLCMIVFLTNGMVSVFSKTHQISSNAIGEDSFVMIAALFRCVLSLAVILIIAAIGAAHGKKGVLRTAFWEIGKTKMTAAMFVLLIVFSAAYSVSNTLGELFSLKCMVTMDASVQFPMLSAIVIVLGAVFGRVFFGEKFTKESTATLALSIVGIVLFMLG